MVDDDDLELEIEILFSNHLAQTIREKLIKKQAEDHRKLFFDNNGTTSQVIVTFNELKICILLDYDSLCCKDNPLDDI